MEWVIAPPNPFEGRHTYTALVNALDDINRKRRVTWQSQSTVALAFVVVLLADATPLSWLVAAVSASPVLALFACTGLLVTVPTVLPPGVSTQWKCVLGFMVILSASAGLAAGLLRPGELESLVWGFGSIATFVINFGPWASRILIPRGVRFRDAGFRCFLASSSFFLAAPLAALVFISQWAPAVLTVCALASALVLWATTRNKSLERGEFPGEMANAFAYSIRAEAVRPSWYIHVIMVYGLLSSIFFYTIVLVRDFVSSSSSLVVALFPLYWLLLSLVASVCATAAHDRISLGVYVIFHQHVPILWVIASITIVVASSLGSPLVSLCVVYSVSFLLVVFCLSFMHLFVLEAPVCSSLAKSASCSLAVGAWSMARSVGIALGTAAAVSSPTVLFVDPFLVWAILVAATSRRMVDLHPRKTMSSVLPLCRLLLASSPHPPPLPEGKHATDVLC